MFDCPPLYSRYIYVCHAVALASGGERLLKIVISVAVAAFSLQWMILYPVKGFMLNF